MKAISSSDTRAGANFYTVRLADWQSDCWALREIRETVFIREQNVPVELEWDEFDANCLHLIATDLEGKPIGTARLLPTGTIGRMAVLKDWRGKGVGSSLLRRLMDESKKRGIKQVVLNAQAHATGFYARHGFQKEGNQFTEAEISHIRMVLPLAEIPVAC